MTFGRGIDGVTCIVAHHDQSIADAEPAIPVRDAVGVDSGDVRPSDLAVGERAQAES